jgi:hypothetical protein
MAKSSIGTIAATSLPRRVSTTLSLPYAARLRICRPGLSWHQSLRLWGLARYKLARKNSGPVRAQHRAGPDHMGKTSESLRSSTWLG